MTNKNITRALNFMLNQAKDNYGAYTGFPEAEKAYTKELDNCKKVVGYIKHQLKNGKL